MTADRQTVQPVAAAEPDRGAVEPDRGGVTAPGTRPLPGGPASEPGLREYLALLRRHWVIALGTFLLVLQAALAATWFVDPVYRTQAEVLVRTEQSEQLFPATSRSATRGLAREPVAEREFTTSDAFRERASAAAPAGAEVEVRHDTANSSLLHFVAEAGDPQTAAAAANAWADTYVTVRHERDLAEIRRLRDVLVRDRDAVAEERRQVLAPVARLDEVIARTTDPVELSRLLNQQLALQRSLSVELDPLEDRLRTLNEQITALDVDARVLEDPEALASVSKAAEVPEARANGSLGLNLAVGLVAGLVLATAAASAARHLGPQRA